MFCSCCVNIGRGRPNPNAGTEITLNNALFCIVRRGIINKARTETEHLSTFGDKFTPKRVGRLFGFIMQKKQVSIMQHRMVRK